MWLGDMNTCNVSLENIPRLLFNPQVTTFVILLSTVPCIGIRSDNSMGFFHLLQFQGPLDVARMLSGSQYLVPTFG